MYERLSFLSQKIETFRQNSSGRGGMGNVTRSSSRPDSKSSTRSREIVAHTTERGGVGDMHLGGPSEKDIKELESSTDPSDLHNLGVYDLFSPAIHLTRP